MNCTKCFFEKLKFSDHKQVCLSEASGKPQKLNGLPRNYARLKFREKLYYLDHNRLVKIILFW